MNHLEATIIELEIELEKRRIEVASIEKCIDLLRNLIPKPEIKKSEPTPKSPRTYRKKQNRSKRKKIRKSKYKGVTVMEGPDGTNRYRANFWDAKGKKTKYIGTFDHELLAAIAVEKALGNDDEAQRLSGVSDKKQDISVSPMKPTTERYYKCKHCDLETKTRPVQCMGCNSASFDGPLTREI